MIWNPNPIVLNWGPINIRWYGLFFSIGIYLAFKMSNYLNNLDPIKNLNLDYLFNYIFWGTLIGARLGHCLFYDFSYYLKNPFKILFIWEGGLASHGALIGVLISIFIYSKKYEVSFLKISDIITSPASLAGAFIRVGNFFNSEIIGHKTNLPWGIIFTRIDNISRHPTQIYEAFFYFLFSYYLFYLYKFLNFNKKEGQIFGIYLFLTFLLRFVIEFLKLPQSQFEIAMILDMGQLLSIPFIFLGGYFYFRKSNFRLLHFFY